MANELRMSATIEYEDSRGAVQSFSAPTRKRTVTTKRPVKLVQSVGIVEEAIGLGDVGTPKEIGVRNLDPTNTVQIKSGTGGVIVASLDPDTKQDGTGGFCLIPLGSGMTAPYAIAITAACDIEVFVVPA